MINEVILIGRLTKDVEVQTTTSGKSVSSFSLAVDNYIGNGQKSCSFIPCTAWGPIAQNLARFCGKGSQVCVEGRLQQRTYQSKTETRSVVEVICTNIEFLERRKNDSKQSFDPIPSDEAQLDTEYSQDSLGLDNDDNLPF